MRMVVACNEVTEREREAEYVQLMIHDPNSVHPADYSQNHAVSLTPLDLLGFVFAISSSMMFSQQPRFGSESDMFRLRHFPVIRNISEPRKGPAM